MFFAALCVACGQPESKNGGTAAAIVSGVIIALYYCMVVIYGVVVQAKHASSVSCIHLATFKEKMEFVCVCVFCYGKDDRLRVYRRWS